MEIENFEYFKLSFDEEEIEIIEEYIGGKSIRQITQNHPNYGRTKTRNLISKFQKKLSKEDAKKIEEKIKKDKYHKKEDEEFELVNLSEEQIKEAYEEIKSGKTLTEIAKTYGKTRDYIKNKILESIKDEEEYENFLEILKENQHPSKEDMLYNLTEEEIKRIVFDKLNKHRSLQGRNEYSYETLNKKYEALKEYLLKTRNKKIDEDDKITENEFFYMIYNTPTLLSSSLKNRIIPALENLDNHKKIGTRNANRIIRQDSSILNSSISRTNLQIRILTDNGLLESCFVKPQNFRTSPELMYAMIQAHKNISQNKTNVRNVFVEKNKLEQQYGDNADKLVKKYPVKNEYSDDKYFDEDK